MLSALLERLSQPTLLVRAASSCASGRGRVLGAAARLAEAVALFCERARLEPTRRSPSSAPARRLCRSRSSSPPPGQRRSSPRRSSNASLSASTCCGRPRRRSPPADAAGDDRVELRPALHEEQRLFAPSPSSRAAARSRPPKRSPTPTSTPCSRSSRRASSRFTNERYWMLETIREYAGERLDGSEEQ